MENNNKFITTTVVATALFVSPWAVVCSAAAYGVWKAMENNTKREEEQERVRKEEYDKHSERTNSTDTDNTVSEEPIIELNQDDIDELLKPE